MRACVSANDTSSVRLLAPVAKEAELLVEDMVIAGVDIKAEETNTGCWLGSRPLS